MTTIIDLREIRGLQIFEKGTEVKRMDALTYKVRSQSQKGTVYHVVKEGEGWRCECPDHTYREVVCKHIHAVVFSINLRDKVASQNTCLGLPDEKPDRCKFCSSPNLVKRGLQRNKNVLMQIFMCKDCKRRFVVNEGFLKMRYDPKVITSALDLYFKGVSLRKVVDHLKQFYGVKVSHVAVLGWIKKYVGITQEYLKDFIPQVSDTWLADEMTVNIDGKHNWLWNLMDEQTRFLLSSQISKKREIQDARKSLAEAKQIAGKRPQEIITDGLWAYTDAIKKEYYTLKSPRTRHIRLPSIRERPNNNKIERLHGTLRERDKVMRALDNDESAPRIVEGMKINYNYLRPHMSLEGKTPAEVAGINLNLGGNRWLSLIRMSATKPRLS